jgi:cyclopropane-fatty-acyl-phospholipid synthase
MQHPLPPPSATSHPPAYAVRRSRARALVGDVLERAGVELDGARPWDPQVHDERVFARILRHGTLGVGESYMDGWWDCDRLDELVARVLRAGAGGSLLGWRDAVAVLRARLTNANRVARAFDIGRFHYDLGDDLFAAMLDRRLTYSCGYWKDAADLDAAQEAKLDLVCRKLRLAPGMRVLDIGCGWGGFAIHAAERYGARVVGVTVSAAQQRVATERGRGLPVEFRLQDYRALDERFDAIASIGMFEHVGRKNYRTYLDVVRRCLAPDGLFLLHSIGCRRATASGDRWFQRYIFPGSHIPEAAEIVDAIGATFVIEDWHNFGADYDRTLLAWARNVAAAWRTLRARYDERFYRMWRYYLLASAGAFRSRELQLWQLVLSKDGVVGGYRSVR